MLPKRLTNFHYEAIDPHKASGVHCHTNDQPAASTIGTAPTADFSAASTSGATPYEAHFSDLSLDDPTAWEWDFGDGAIGNDQSPTHIYAADGTYTVSLTAASAAGRDTRVRTNYISVPEPGAVLQLWRGASACGA